MNRDEFVDIMAAMVEMYPGRFEKLGDLAMEMWFECLSDLDYEKTREAVKNHVKLNKYPPTVADIREQYGLIVEECRSESMTLRDIFNDMCNYYPNGSSDKSAESVFMSKLLMVEKSDKPRVANAIKNLVIAYVKRCEQGELELNMTLSECIQESAKGVNL